MENKKKKIIRGGEDVGWRGREIEKYLFNNYNIILNVGTLRVACRLFSLPPLSHVSEILPVVLNFCI